MSPLMAVSVAHPAMGRMMAQANGQGRGDHCSLTADMPVLPTKAHLPKLGLESVLHNRSRFDLN